GYLYGASHFNNNAKWVCLDWKTGRMTYAERGVGQGSAACADCVLYTLNEHGKMGLVKPTPDGHEVVSQFRIPEGGEGPTWAHPVVAGGRLYVRHGDRLYAFDVRAK
ncbi:MAG: PQQ-binding-like beta-propeller repeat protein, partial [Planctomycetota bacterium]